MSLDLAALLALKKIMSVGQLLQVWKAFVQQCYGCIVSCKDDIYNNMYDNVMQDTQQILGAGDDSSKVSK